MNGVVPVGGHPGGLRLQTREGQPPAPQLSDLLPATPAALARFPGISGWAWATEGLALGGVGWGGALGSLGPSAPRCPHPCLGASVACAPLPRVSKGSISWWRRPGL